jgi:hypothetical protein
MAYREVLTMIALGLTGCSGDEAAYKPPIELRHDLQPGEKVVCESSFIWLGLPFANRETAVIFWQRHRFECRLERTG